MRVKTIQDEDFLNYKKPSMLICTIQCNGKCCHEAGIDPSVCQNSMWANEPTIKLKDLDIVHRYMKNPITQAIVFGGLEPLEQAQELIELISYFRLETDDDIVIYTGYTEEELKDDIPIFQRFPNIIFKFGRFVPDGKPVIDPVLGVKLISDNQYGKKIS